MTDEEKQMNILEMQQHIIKIRAMVEYHVLAASNYVLQIQQIEKLIEEGTENS